MTSLERRILRSLLQLEDTVKAMASANPKPDLKPILGEVDELTRQLPSETDPNLLHYLHRKSFQKARLFLEQRHAETD